MNDDVRSAPGSGAPARDALLAETFVSLADTLVDDYDVVDLLDRLVAACVGLFDVSAAGLLLLDQRGGLQPIASSNEDARLMELFQLQNSEGPCLDSIRTREVVDAPDLSKSEQRWPLFAPAALGHGFRSVLAIPMRLRDQQIGGLNLFSATVTTMDALDHRVAQSLADVATIGILQQRSVQRASLLAEQLQAALDSRVLIEQAKGVLAESGKLDMTAAFEALRSFSRSSNQKLSGAAESLVRGRVKPSDVLSAGPHPPHRP
jgi:GAF domain-containing protein